LRRRAAFAGISTSIIVDPEMLGSNRKTILPQHRHKIRTGVHTLMSKQHLQTLACDWRPCVQRP